SEVLRALAGPPGRCSTPPAAGGVRGEAWRASGLRGRVLICPKKKGGGHTPAWSQAALPPGLAAQPALSGGEKSDTAWARRRRVSGPALGVPALPASPGRFRPWKWNGTH